MIHHTTLEASVVEVVRTVSARGEGVTEDPVREVVQFWSPAGELLAEHDPEKEKWWNVREFGRKAP